MKGQVVKPVVGQVLGKQSNPTAASAHQSFKSHRQRLGPGMLIPAALSPSCEAEAPGELWALLQANYIRIFEGVAWIAIYNKSVLC